MRERFSMARGPLGLATLLASSVAATFSCGGGHGGGFTPDAPPVDASSPAFGNEAGAPCSGLACQAVRDDCAKKGKPPTTLSGKVYDPAGALPLYDVFVYVPNAPLEPLTPGHPTCTSCQAPASGAPIVGGLTDPNGVFSIGAGGDVLPSATGVPSGDDVPLVVQVGKWRRQVKVPHIEACTANVLPDPASPADKLRLPAKSSEGDMPLIAFTSGCDPAECFLRRIGIDDSEFVPPTSPTGHVHFYTGRDVTSSTGSGSQVAGGNASQDTYAWWTDKANLDQYDIVFNACECGEIPRGAGAYAAMHDYLSGGGRVFTTHFYYNWFAPPSGPPDFNGVALWSLDGSLTSTRYFIDTSFPKGTAFAEWLQANNVTTNPGQIDLVDTRGDVAEITPKATRWIYNAAAPGDADYSTVYMSFNTPLEKPAAAQCGRAVFSDVHLSGKSNGAQFPSECAHPDATYAANEKALEFLFFDLSSCVQDDTKTPPPPPIK